MKMWMKMLESHNPNQWITSDDRSASREFKFIPKMKWEIPEVSPPGGDDSCLGQKY